MLVTRNSASPGVEYGVPFDPTLPRNPLRRLISLATLAVFSLILAACGGAAAADADPEFDQAEFQAAVLESAPAGLTMQVDGFPTDDIPGVESVQIGVTVNTAPHLLKLDLTLSGSTSVTLNIIATDAAAYMNVGQGWMKAPPTDDLTEMAAEFGGGFDSEVISESAWVYKAEVPCGDDICWQVESPDGALMNLTRNDYSPVSMTIVEDGAEIIVDILHWGDTVDVELPADAREVTSEELMSSLLGALLPLVAGGL